MSEIVKIMLEIKKLDLKRNYLSLRHFLFSIKINHVKICNV